MNRLLTASLAALLLAGTAAGAMAQPAYHGDNGHGPYGNGPPGQSQAHRGWTNGQSNWRRGGHVASGDWDRGERVDYRQHHLRRPGRGYEWRRVDNHYVLAAVATGVIASIILNSDR
jgi:Ni/Co efflux regulator RcnB